MPIRQRITEGYDLEARVLHFVLRYLYDNVATITSRGVQSTGRITLGYIYDDELEFLLAFLDKFPGRSKKYEQGKRRLSKWMNQFAKDGWIAKGRIYNDKHYIGEAASGWYPAYHLYEEDADRIYEKRTTIEDLVYRYTGRLPLDQLYCNTI